LKCAISIRLFSRSQSSGRSDFAPREYFGAHYIEVDYSEGYAEIIKDFQTPQSG
jgi:hypothetical protein